MSYCVGLFANRKRDGKKPVIRYISFLMPQPPTGLTLCNHFAMANDIPAVGRYIFTTNACVEFMIIAAFCLSESRCRGQLKELWLKYLFSDENV